jgi:SAM-dependent methyltransferase
MRSYAAQSRSLAATVREAIILAQRRSLAVSDQVSAVVDRLRDVDRLALDKLGLELRGLTMLDVGAGQMLLQASYFAVRNEVVAIDLDEIVHGFAPRAYIAMWRRNGARRVLKTVGRKSLLVDVRHKRELARQLHLRRLPTVQAQQMDASHMGFDNASFDFAYSLAVFQHLEDPGSVVKEMARVLRPGGGLYLDFILYTSRTGSHDVRHLADPDAPTPLWAHLRPQYQSLVAPNAYVNKIRLEGWREIFTAALPGHELLLRQPEAEWLTNEAEALRQAGELESYELDELLSTKVIVLWKKPTQPPEALEAVR